MERFMELYQTVYKDLYRLAYYYMGNAQDVEDVVQDATLSACQPVIAECYFFFDRICGLYDCNLYHIIF